MKNNPITFHNETIHPGEQLSFALPLPEMFSCAPMYMPIKIIHGKQAGPCLLVIAALHGNELNGAEIINRLLQSTTVKKLKGTLIAVPILNVYGFINKTRSLPGGANLGQSFPGNPTGSHAARLAHLFCSELFALADYCIDLQTGLLNHTNLPQTYVTDEHQDELNLARALAAPVISEVSAKKGSLRAYANQQQTPYIIYEAGEAMRFDEASIRLGVKGIKNVMRHIDMLPMSPKTSSHKATSFVVRDSRWLRSPTSGISYSNIKLGQQVEKGQRLCMIRDPFGAGDDVEVLAPFAGIVVSMNNLPLVYEGVSLFQLASFQRLSQAASHFENWLDASEEQAEG